jgi:hypothetical protein
MNTMDTTLDSATPAAELRPVASRRLSRPLAIILIAAALPLAACKRDAVITGTIYPDDYRQRHPIALTNEPETLDVFVGRNMAGLDARQGTNSWLTVSIKEGKNREIRRVMAHMWLEVTRLIRTAYGPFQLGILPRGAVEEVNAKVLRPSKAPLAGRRGLLMRPAKAAEARKSDL